MPVKESAAIVWTPVGIPAMEPAALEAVQSLSNTLVVAGPGAGKTELLAQRACYLLQTGLCPFPRQILAISFKRDAARNLAERVQRRCGPELARRFHSYTFDAFAKGIVDRFGQALPPHFRPKTDYEVGFDITANNIGRFLRETLTTNGSTLTDEQRQGVNGEQLYWGPFVGRPLQVEAWGQKPAVDRAAAEIWQHVLHGDASTGVTFHMIGRLAELVLRTNPHILRALRSAYAYVFLDEFQDTSGIHWDLTVQAFSGSNVILTAVGDNKQRVNKWAGALDGIFDLFRTQFSADRIDLRMNYRSAPELVRIQSYFAAAIDDEAPPAIAAQAAAEKQGECRALLFSSFEDEARCLADLIAGWVQKDKLGPRDVCVLCRMRPDSYTAHLQDQLAIRGIPARVENELQDLLAEPITEAIIHLLRLAAADRASKSWSAVVDLLCQLRGQLSDAQERAEVKRLDKFIRRLKKQVALLADLKAMQSCLDEIVDFFGRAALKATIPQYAKGKYLRDTVAKLGKELSVRLSQRSLHDALDDLEGAHAIPIMTMHKSKGLEYHTVVFVGLEDSAIWGYEDEPTEETCGFFVALSRAKQRVIFTFSNSRPDRHGRIRGQSRTTIGRLYELLKEAGVTPEEIEL